MLEGARERQALMPNPEVGLLCIRRCFGGRRGSISARHPLKSPVNDVSLRQFVGFERRRSLQSWRRRLVTCGASAQSSSIAMLIMSAT
jgi:hypothetical protein